MRIKLGRVFSLVLAAVTGVSTAYAAPDLLLVGTPKEMKFYAMGNLPALVGTIALGSAPISAAVSFDNKVGAAAAMDRFFWFDLTVTPPALAAEVRLPANMTATQVAFSDNRLLVLAQTGGVSNLLTYRFFTAVAESTVSLADVSNRIAGAGDVAFVSSVSATKVTQIKVSTSTVVSSDTCAGPCSVVAWSTGYAFASSAGFTMYTGTAMMFTYRGEVDYLTPLGPRVYLGDASARKTAGTDSAPNLRAAVKLNGRPVGIAASADAKYLYAATVNPNGGAIEVIQIGSASPDAFLTSVGLAVSPTCLAATR